MRTAQRVKQDLRRKMIRDGADEVEKQLGLDEVVYQVPTSDPYLAQSIAIVLRNRGFKARVDGNCVRVTRL